MVTTFYPPYNLGGDGLFVQQLARELAGAGHHVEVVHCTDAWRVVSGRREPEPARDLDDGVTIHRLASRFGKLSPLMTQQTGRPGLKRGALERVLDQGFDVINFHNISLIGGPGVLELGTGVKAFTLHEHWWVCPTHVLFKYTGELCTERDCLRCCLANRTPPQAWRLRQSWMARCLSEVDVILAPSEFTAARHRAWMDEAKIDVPLRVVPEYSIPLPELGPAPGDLPERFFLYVGRLSRVKGIDRLLAAFAKRPDYPLVVVGQQDSAREAVLEAPANARLVGRVPREELRSYYASARALVFPSACAETFGLAAAEALSCGTPVISSRCGGTEEIVTEEVGRLYADESQLLAQLDMLWTDGELCERLGRAARARYLANYTPEAYLARYMDTIDAAQSERAARE